jgi:hypothetical protein
MPHYSWDCYTQSIFNRELELLELEADKIDKDFKEKMQTYLKMRVKQIQEQYKD